MISEARSANQQVPCPFTSITVICSPVSRRVTMPADALTAAAQLLERHLPVVRDHRAVLRLHGVPGHVDGEHLAALESEHRHAAKVAATRVRRTGTPGDVEQRTLNAP